MIKKPNTSLFTKLSKKINNTTAEILATDNEYDIKQKEFVEENIENSILNLDGSFDIEKKAPDELYQKVKSKYAFEYENEKQIINEIKLMQSNVLLSNKIKSIDLLDKVNDIADNMLEFFSGDIFLETQTKLIKEAMATASSTQDYERIANMLHKLSGATTVFLDKRKQLIGDLEDNGNKKNIRITVNFENGGAMDKRYNKSNLIEG